LVSKTVLSAIKENLESMVGAKIKIRAFQGKKKTIERTGILEETYPHIFVIKLEETSARGRRLSYSYSDVLTESIKISILPSNCDENS